LNMHDSSFLRQLGIWGLHTTICAAPSFVIAYMSGFQTLTSIAAMLCGIVSMIFLYAGIYTQTRIAGTGNSAFRRAARYGARTRSVMCLLVLPTMGIFPPLASVILLPDLFAGYIALTGVNLITGRNSTITNASFFQVYSATVLEALMVSGAIFLLFWLGVVLGDPGRPEVRVPRMKSSKPEVF